MIYGRITEGWNWQKIKKGQKVEKDKKVKNDKRSKRLMIKNYKRLRVKKGWKWQKG